MAVMSVKLNPVKRLAANVGRNYLAANGNGFVIANGVKQSD